MVALKRWPANIAPDRLVQIHHWMDLAAHVPFVPTLVRTHTNETYVRDASHLWDATTWHHGYPCERPGAEEVENACAAAALLHEVWRHLSLRGASPGIRRRIDVLSQWLANPERIATSPEAAVTELLPRARSAIDRCASTISQALQRWENVPLRLQPCVRDLRGEHLLFTATQVTGIVDYGAMDVDTPTLDLARLLGDLAGEDTRLFALGVQKYRERNADFEASTELFARLPDRPASVGFVSQVPTGDLGYEINRSRTIGKPTGEQTELIAWLDRAGAVCSLIGWVQRIAGNDVPVSPAQLVPRIRKLIDRVEQIL